MLKHLTGATHPEAPARYATIIEELSFHKLLRSDNSITPNLAARDVLALCHSLSYIELVENECRECAKRPASKLATTLSTGDATICQDTYEIACLSAGAAIAAVDALMEGAAERVFCCSRPPGHHATRTAGMGFCIFNNAAIAARYAQHKGFGKIAILDWDVHHGNGTQAIVEADPSIFYFSTHQEGLYPGTGLITDTGVQNILNCPIKGAPGARNKVLEAFHVPLENALSRFKPELIIISAGFDGHVDDPLGGFDLTENDFETLTWQVRKLADEHCGGKLISILEGGYNLPALAKSATAHVRALGHV